VGGVEKPITEDGRREIMEANAGVAARGMRVPGLACKEVDADSELSYDERRMGRPDRSGENGRARGGRRLPAGRYQNGARHGRPGADGGGHRA
jgi:hypothetical protein